MLKRRRTASPSEHHRRLGMIGIRSLLKVLQRKPRVKYIFTEDYISHNLREKTGGTASDANGFSLLS